MYSSAMSQPDDAVGDVATPDDPDALEENQGDSEPGGELLLRERQEQTEVSPAEDSSVDTQLPSVPPIHSSVTQMLCASQTLDAVTLTPEVVPPPDMPALLLPPPALYSPRFDGDLVW